MATLDEQVRTLLKTIQKLDAKEKGAQICSIYDECNWPKPDVDHYLATAEEHSLIAKFDDSYRLTDSGKQYADCGIPLKNVHKLNNHKTIFSWGEVPIRLEKIAKQDYKIAIMDLRGRGTPDKVKEAKEKGYVLLSSTQLEMLHKIKPYLTRMPNVKKIAAKIGIYESKVLAFLEIYKAAGINLKYPSQVSPRQSETKPEIEIKEAAEPQNEFGKLLEDYKAGQEQSYKAMEHIMDMLKQKDAKINDLEERIGQLEKLIKK